jgi:hypothetical protein
MALNRDWMTSLSHAAVEQLAAFIHFTGTIASMSQNNVGAITGNSYSHRWNQGDLVARGNFREPNLRRTGS